MTNLLNTGCFIYPVHFTCLENLSWSIPVEEVKKMNNWYELWSKAGAGPNFRIEKKRNIYNTLVGSKIGSKFIFLIRFQIF